MANGFNAYQREMARRGLGSVFQTEGPERVGAGQRFTRSFDNREAGRANLTDVYGPDIPPYLMEDIFNVGGLLDQIVSAGSETITPQPMTTAERRQQGAAIRREAAAPRTGLEEAEFFPSGLDPDKWQTPEDFVPFQPPKDWNVIEAKEPPKAGVPIIGEGPKKSMLAGGRGTVVEKPGERAAAIDTAFVQAMQEFNKAAGKEDDTAEMSDAELLEKYKQEFADATGIDVSGKVDKSQALMAFGLALMQNRAGKGFNVGNMLRAVGEAGEKALPELKAAKQEARAARVAAGKYALQRIESGRNAKAALALEQQKFAQEAYLKKMELDAKASEGPEIKNVSTIKPIAGLELRMGTANGRSVWAGGVPAANMIVRSYNSAQKALNTLNEIESSISEVANSPSPSFTLLADRLNTALTGLGLKDPKVAFGEDAVSPEQKADALRKSLVQEFKRFLTQETGNGISNVDVTNILDLLGKMDLIGNPQDAIFRVNQVRGVFEGKISGLTPFIEDLQDPDMYTSTQEYEKVQGILDKDLGAAPGMKVEISDGVPTVDLTKGN